MQRIRHRYLWAPLPCLPLLWLSVTMAAGLVERGELWNFQTLAAILASGLGGIGCVGLVLAGIPLTYANPHIRFFAMSCIFSGLVATGIVIATAISTHEIARNEPNISTHNGTFFAFLLLLALLLAWPCVAGVSAFGRLRKDE